MNMFTSFRQRISLGLLIWWFFTSVVIPVYSPLARAADLSEMHQMMTSSGGPVPGDHIFSSPPQNSGSVPSDYFYSEELTPRNDVIHDRQQNRLTLPLLGSDNGREDKTDEASKEKSASFNEEQAVQERLRSLWSFLGQNSRKEAARNIAADYATNMANQMMDNAIRDWLGQKGNARIQLTTQGQGSADVLVPFWDVDNDLVFSQAGGRLNRDRTIWNAGIGGRHYFGDVWMLGANAFYDYDQTGRNARWGVGLEARTDSLSLAANRYFRLTDWHQSPLEKMRDYDERPANGYDLRAKYWLPFYPQVGGELVYEKYFGKGVDLSGSASPDSLKDSPHSVTATVSYTPFPLLTVSLGQASGDISETTAKLDLSWRFGLSLAEHLDSNNVSIMRSLKGSRYDLVDRNFDIVMQYRKQKLVALSLPPEIRGEALSRVKVQASARAKYGIRNITWLAPELVSAGGSISTTASLTDVNIHLPAWNAPDSGKNNIYRLTAIMTDVEGNQTDPVGMNIVVDEASHVISLALNAERGPVGQEISGRLSVSDSHGNPMKGLGATLSLTPKLASRVLANTEGCLINHLAKCHGHENALDQNGIHDLVLNHVKSGVYTLKVKMATGSQAAVDVIFEPDSGSSTLTTENLRVIVDNAIANGIAANKVKATVTDAYGNPVSSQNVAFMVTNGAEILSSGQTNSNGEVTVNLTSRIAGRSVVTASINGVNQLVNVNFTADSSTAQIASGALTVEENDAAADGRATNGVKVRVTDANNNVVPGVVVAFSASNGAAIASSGITNSAGEILATLTSVRAGESNVTASINGSSQSVPVLFVAGAASSTKSELKASPDTIVVDNIQTSELSLTLKDANGNLITGQNSGISFIVSGLAVSDYTLSTVNYYQAESGIYTATLKGTKTGTAIASALVNGDDMGSTSVHLTSRSGGGGVGDDGSVRLDATSPVVIGQGSNLVVVLKDVNDNPVIGAAGDITVSSNITGQESARNWTESTTAPGTYTSSLIMTRSGMHTLTASIDGSSQSDSGSVQATLQSSESAVQSMTLTSVDSVTAGDDLIVMVTLTDAYGNPVINLSSALMLSSDKENTGTVSFIESSTPGTYQATLKLTLAATHALTARLNGVPGMSKTKNVTVIAGAAVSGKSSLSPAMQTITANNIDEATVTLKLLDAYQNPTDIGALTVSLQQTTSLAGVTTSAWTKVGPGVYQSKVTGATVGEGKFTLATGGANLTPVTVKFAPLNGTSGVAGASLNATPAVVNAGAETQLTLMLTDAFGNGVVGVAVRDIALVSNVPGQSVSVLWSEGQNGVYTATLPLMVAGGHTLMATVNGHDATAAVTVNNLSGGNSVNSITLNASPSTINAGETITATVMLKDQYGNGVTDAASDITLTSGSESLSGIVFRATATTGEYAATLPLMVAGGHTLMATVNGHDATAAVTVNNLSGGNSVNSITLNASPSTINAGETITATVMLKDQYGNGVTDAASDITLTSGSESLSGIVFRATATTGEYAATLPLMVAGGHTLMATVNGHDATAAVTVNNLSGGNSVNSITLNASPSTINAGETITATVMLKDQYGNGVTDAASDITLTSGSESLSGIVFRATATTGEYAATLPLMVAGGHTLMATVNGHDATAAVTVNNLSGGNSVNSITLNASPSTINAGETITATVMLKDQYGNGVTDAASDITLTSGSESLSGIVFRATATTGEYAATLPLMVAGGHTLMATVNGHDATESVMVSVPHDITDVAGVSLAASSVLLNVGESTILTVTATDRYGNGVTGLVGDRIVIGGVLANQSLSGLNWTESVAGVYTASALVMTVAGTHALTATVNSIVSTQLPVNVVNLSGVTNVDAIALTATPAIVNMDADIVLKLVATDRYNNRVTGLTSGNIAVTSSIAGQGSSGLTWTEGTGANTGIYTSSALKMTVAGVHNLTAMVNNKSDSASVQVIKMISIAGIARDMVTDKVIPGASISVSTESGDEIASVVAGSDGKFNIYVADGMYVIKSKATGYLDTSLTTSDPVNDVRTIYMVPEQYKDDVVVIQSVWSRGDIDVALMNLATGNYAGYGGSPGTGMSWDRDDRNGGVEVVTIRKGQVGEWRFSLTPYGTTAVGQEVKVNAYVIDSSSGQSQQVTVRVDCAVRNYKKVLSITRSSDTVPAVISSISETGCSGR